jgi:predicted N-acetyltransferase YhbS
MSAVVPTHAAEGEPMEVRLVDALRRSDAWMPALSWVVERDGVVVGHVVCTRGHVDEVAAVGLGPLGVDRPRRVDHRDVRLRIAVHVGHVTVVPGFT